MDEYHSLEEQLWMKLRLLPAAQQQMILGLIESLLSQNNPQSQERDPNPQRLFVESCGVWQADPRTAETLIEEIYSTRTSSAQEYDL